VISINKGRVPASLTFFIKANKNASFEDLSANVKADIKNSLLEEQNGLCAYCMRHIEYSTMRIEHWLPQSQAKDNVLDYSNMLGVCAGVIGEEYCCDNFRGKAGYGNNGDVKYNPANRAHQLKLKIRYTPSGEIVSDDAEFNVQLKNTLNLNNDYMKASRNSVFKAVCQALEKANKGNSLTKVQCTNVLNNWKRCNETGQLPEYCAVAFYVIEKRLARFKV